MLKAEGELRKINEEHLIEKSMIFKNTALLNDCKPTKEFLTMEQRKAGYCSISKLNVRKHDPTSGKDIIIEVTDPIKVRDEMKNFYQSIFNKQEVLEGSEAITNFLTSQGDTEPLLELNRRKLSDAQRDSLEGQITLEELTSALQEDMKGFSAPGIDGFTVNFIREFWSPLGEPCQERS